MGLVLVEAIGCGCPVLVGDVPAVAEVLGSSMADLTVQAWDAEALAIRMVAVLRSPMAAYKQAEQLRADCQLRFDWRGVGGRYSKLLENKRQPVASVQTAR